MAWTDSDFGVLFDRHPPTEHWSPTDAWCTTVGQRLRLPRYAVKAQWDDARSLVLGAESGASDQLRAYVGRRGWLDRTAEH